MVCSCDLVGVEGTTEEPTETPAADPADNEVEAPSVEEPEAAATEPEAAEKLEVPTIEGNEWYAQNETKKTFKKMLFILNCNTHSKKRKSA